MARGAAVSDETITKVLLDRDLTPRHVAVPTGARADATFADATPSNGHQDSNGLGPGARRAAATVWQLARGLQEMSSMLDERPRGLLVWRMIAKVPVVGAAGGWLDERGGIRRTSKRTARLLRR